MCLMIGPLSSWIARSKTSGSFGHENCTSDGLVPVDVSRNETTFGTEQPINSKPVENWFGDHALETSWNSNE